MLPHRPVQRPLSTRPIISGAHQQANDSSAHTQSPARSFRVGAFRITYYSYVQQCCSTSAAQRSNPAASSPGRRVNRCSSAAVCSRPQASCAVLCCCVVCACGCGAARPSTARDRSAARCPKSHRSLSNWPGRIRHCCRASAVEVQGLSGAKAAWTDSRTTNGTPQKCQLTPKM